MTLARWREIDDRGQSGVKRQKLQLSAERRRGKLRRFPSDSPYDN